MVVLVRQFEAKVSNLVNWYNYKILQYENVKAMVMHVARSQELTLQVDCSESFSVV